MSARRVASMRTVWFITHPEVRLDPAVPVPQWSLSERGRSRAAALAGQQFLREVRSVWSSTEVKAVETAALLTAGSDLPVRTDARLGENDRSATGFVPPAEFESLADRFFESPSASVRGWERAVDAQTRVVSAVEALLADPESGGADVVIAAHGAVGTLLQCHLRGIPISRSLDQPGPGHVFAFEATTGDVQHGWRPLESLLEATGGQQS